MEFVIVIIVATFGVGAIFNIYSEIKTQLKK